MSGADVADGVRLRIHGPDLRLPLRAITRPSSRAPGHASHLRVLLNIVNLKETPYKASCYLPTRGQFPRYLAVVCMGIAVIYTSLEPHLSCKLCSPNPSSSVRWTHRWSLFYGQYIRLLLFLFDCLPPVNIWLPLLYMQEVIDVFSVRENVECNCSWKRDLLLYDGAYVMVPEHVQQSYQGI